MKKKITVAWLLCCAVYGVFAADDSMLTGLDAYSRGEWAASAAAFEQVLETQPESRTEALYWLVMAETSAENYPYALNYADAFLTAASDDERAAEVRYQKGRILYLSGRYKDSSEVMYQFIKDYPEHPKVPSAYYWIGENLYAEGLYTAARKVFATLVVDYPNSGKVSEARYKIVLIDQQAVRSELAQIVNEAQATSTERPPQESKQESAVEKAAVEAAEPEIRSEALPQSEEQQRRDEEIAGRLKALEEKIDSLAESLSKMAAEQESLRAQEQQEALERQQREETEKKRAEQELQEKQKQAAEARQKELEGLKQQSRTLEQLYKQRTKGAQ